MNIRAILGVSILLLVSVQVNASLIINGGFEEPTIDRTEHRSGFELIGWESYSSYVPQQGDDPGSVHFTSRYSPVSEGNKAVQLEVPGDWIRQSFTTTIDQWYVLSLDLSAYTAGVTVLGVSVGSLSTQLAGSPSEYVTYNLEFMALSGLTTLTFTSLGESGTFPHIDNVSVELSPIPVPAAFWLFGTALIGLVGFSKRRKAA